MNKKTKHLLRINEKPYFLLGNYEVDANIDFENKTLDTEHKKDVLFEKAHPAEIFSIKFLPYLTLLFLMYRFPKTNSEIFISFLSIICIYLFKMVHTYFSDFLTKLFYTIFFVLLIITILKIDNSFRYINFFIISLVSNFVFFLFLNEYKKFGIKNYYKILNVRKEGTLKIKMRRTKFMTRLKYNLEGFYFTLLKERKNND